MTLTYTSRLKLAVPDFLTEPWHSEFAQAMESIDRLVYDVILQQGANLWLNSHAYVIGDVVISPDTGSLYTCATPHTSSASPQTFTAELAAHPTFWTVTAPTAATQAEAEAGVDNTKFMTPLRTKQAITALTSQTALFTPRAGRLTRVSLSQLKFSPFNGNKVKINGVLYDIPSGGIAGLNNTGVFVNGISGQNLAPNTTYYVYAENHGGIIGGNFAALGHRPSQTVGNEGVEVGWNGAVEFPNSTLIGVIRTSGGGQFLDDNGTRFVRSWFNDPGVALVASYTANRSVANTIFREISTEGRLNFLNWESELVFLEFSGPFFSTGGTAETIYVSLGQDGTTATECFTQRDTFADTKSEDMTASITLTPTEGSHFATPLARSFSGNSVTLKIDANSAGRRPTFRGFIPARG